MGGGANSDDRPETLALCILISRIIHSNGISPYWKYCFEGFEIYWDAATTGCGGSLTGPEGYISSPNYPQARHLYDAFRQTEVGATTVQRWTPQLCRGEHHNCAEEGTTTVQKWAPKLCRDKHLISDGLRITGTAMQRSAPQK